MLEIAHDLRLSGIALGPGPLLLEFVGEGEGIVVALGIATRAGIAVPVPGAAHTVGGLQDLRRQAQLLAQAVEPVQAVEAGADDEGVIRLAPAFPRAGGLRRTPG